MRTFLVFTIEPYRLMVDALRVHELLERDRAGRVRGGGHLSWRGRLVPEVALADLLGRKSAAPAGGVDLIYGDDMSATLVMLRADRVVGLRDINESDLHFLPPLGPELSRLFSGLVLDPADGKGTLWLDAWPEVLLDMGRDLREAAAAPRYQS